MENNIIDLFADPVNTTSDKSKGQSKNINGKDKSSMLKSSVMKEAMGLLSNPKKLKGIITAIVLLILIGLGSTVAFFIIYPVCIIWAIVSWIAIIMGGKVFKLLIKKPK